MINMAKKYDKKEKYQIKNVEQTYIFFFKQKTAYGFVSRDWSSDVCSSDLKYWGLTHPNVSSHSSKLRFGILALLVQNSLFSSQIGRASCRERVQISVVAVSLKKKNNYEYSFPHSFVFNFSQPLLRHSFRSIIPPFSLYRCQL